MKRLTMLFALVFLLASAALAAGLPKPKLKVPFKGNKDQDQEILASLKEQYPLADRNKGCASNPASYLTVAADGVIAASDREETLMLPPTTVIENGNAKRVTNSQTVLEKGMTVCAVDLRVKNGDATVIVLGLKPFAYTVEGTSKQGFLWGAMKFKGYEPNELMPAIATFLQKQGGETTAKPATAAPIVASVAQPTPVVEAAPVSINIGDPVSKVENVAGKPVSSIGTITVYNYQGIKILVENGKVVKTAL